LGTEQYAAPEYFLGDAGSPRSDLFSLAVIAYQMLSGRLPYGAQVGKTRTKEAQRRLVYASVLDDTREIPAWVDEALKKAVHPNPFKRYEEVSEFIHDLRQPSQAFLSRARPPLMERNPVAFWRGVALVLAVVVVILLVTIARLGK
jgi:serine/threonine protein kinase